VSSSNAGDELSRAGEANKKQTTSIEYPMRCVVCGLQLSDSGQRGTHMAHEHAACYICDEVPQSAIQGHEHRRRSGHGSCNACNESFRTPKTFTLHVRKFHEADGIRCRICQRLFADEVGCTWHCCLCEFFPKRFHWQALEAHMKHLHASDRSPTRFAMRHKLNDLEEFKVQELDAEKAKRREVQKTAPQQGKKRKRSAKNTPKRKSHKPHVLQCIKCDKTFMRLKDYERHVANWHDSVPVPCPLPTCSRSFREPLDMLMHFNDGEEGCGSGMVLYSAYKFMIARASPVPAWNNSSPENWIFSLFPTTQHGRHGRDVRYEHYGNEDGSYESDNGDDVHITL